MPLNVTINGVDRSLFVDARSFSISDALTSEVDTCNFTYECTDIADKPKEGQEIIVTDGAEKAFGGYIVSAPESEGTGDYIYLVSCVDYQRLLDKHLVVEKYENMYAGDIVKNIITKYTSGFTTVNVKQGPMIKGIPFNYKYPGECLRELCSLIGYEWYVDYNKDVHFFDQESNKAPFSLDDTQFNFDELEITADISQLRNRVYVRGGTYLSEPYTQKIVPDGQQREFLLGYKPHDITVNLNGVAKIVGIENIDDPATKDFMLVYQEKLLKNGTNTMTLANTDLLEPTYRFDTPVLVSVDDADSINRMKGLEGGDGIYEHIIVDPEITSKELARQRAQADLAQYANPVISGSFKTNDKGLRSGQLIHIQQTKRGIDGYFLIRKVTRRYLTVDTYEFSVEIASKLKGIEDLLVQMFAQSRKFEVRDDEVLDKLLNLKDSVKVTDTLTISSGAPESKIGYLRIGYGEIT
jgi:hypothetical protein